MGFAGISQSNNLSREIRLNRFPAPDSYAQLLACYRLRRALESCRMVHFDRMVLLCSPVPLSTISKATAIGTEQAVLHDRVNGRLLFAFRKLF